MYACGLCIKLIIVFSLRFANTLPNNIFHINNKSEPHSLPESSSDFSSMVELTGFEPVISTLPV